MKGYSYALVILLLFSIFTAGCMELQWSGFAWVFEPQEPLGSVCTSPAAKLLKPAGLDQDHCYQQVAVNTGALPLCDKIKRGAPMTKCYMLIAAKQNDPALCSQIPTTSDPQAYLKIDCLWEVATVNNNPAACREMGTSKISRMFIGEMSQQTCLQRLAGGQIGGSTP
jgi:hypothetical protein